MPSSSWCGGSAGPRSSGRGARCDDESPRGVEVRDDESPRGVWFATMNRLAAWWFAPAPAERLAAVRILVGTFALAWVTGRLLEFHAVAKLPATHWKPTGIVKLLDAP